MVLLRNNINAYPYHDAFTQLRNIMRGPGIHHHHHQPPPPLIHVPYLHQLQQDNECVVRSYCYGHFDGPSLSSPVVVLLSLS